MKSKIFKYLILFTCLAYYSPAVAQTADEFDFERIEDNSFLIEEAYNQDPGVIQHISSFQYIRNKKWQYIFTDEWPVPGRKNQLSATIPVLSNGEPGIGDAEINYRFQALISKRLAFSPRITLILPSGNYKKGLGSGVPGYQLGLPVSFLLSRKVVTHYNLGLTVTPNAKNPDGSEFSLTIFNYGASTILLLRKNFNFMLEVAGNTSIIIADGTDTKIASSVFISPGFRYAVNFKTGLQIVPGLAVPVGFGPGVGRVGAFAYLSFEHPLWQPKNPER